MKKILKNKKGFTLVEMVIVIAIILILAAVVFFGVQRFLNAANSTADTLSARNNEVTSVLDVVLP